MIQSGTLTYAASESIIRRWEPSSPLLAALLVATLTTLLSYQLTAISFNLLLGSKPRRKAPVCDLHMLLLVRNLSPIAVLSSLLRWDSLTRARFDLPDGTHIEREEGSVSRITASKLTCLLLIAPVSNIIAVALTLESDTTISLAGAKFSGVTVGVTMDEEFLKFNPLTETCDVALLELRSGEERVSDFSLCRSGVELPNPNSVGLASLTVAITSTFILGMEITIDGRSTYYGKQGYLRTEKNGEPRVFHIPVNVDENELNNFMDHGMQQLAEVCGVKADTAVDVTSSLSYPGKTTKVLKSKVMTCGREGEGLMHVAAALWKHFTFIKSNKMEVFELRRDEDRTQTPPRNRHRIDASDFPLFIRRRRNAGLLELAICTALGVLVHLLTALFCHDDVHLGVEVIMKKGLGLCCCDSGLLENDGVVDYSEKHGLTS